ncbi:hypothetical protein M8J76_011807 [Diaphorina citri]|jgi:hypothetical protein|nr:hypothetical protein M8J75_003257 [Diaphorina citri]KAI5749963.1 hypothetical protein M8J76_011807 [Diaphorina citri]
MRSQRAAQAIARQSLAEPPVNGFIIVLGVNGARCKGEPIDRQSYVNIEKDDDVSKPDHLVNEPIVDNK